MASRRIDAQNIRDQLVRRVAEQSGHLASNLGVVELTLALVNVFDFSRDRIVFDVGHQSHPYKLLTGRMDRFATIGSRGGLNTFPDIFESPFDHYSTGHSGTAVSAALGYSLVRRDVKSVAVIGDGSLTSGETFEALNHAGQLRTNLLVIYNDNGMAISKNVGALAAWGRLRGFAESLGFEYVGPLDGHDMSLLTGALEQVAAKSVPIFMHVKTVKGRGCSFAERDPESFHWTPPFDIDTGTPRWTLSSPYVARLTEMSEDLISQNPSTFFTTPAYGCFALTDLAKKHAAHVIDTGIAEQHCVTFSSALALGGARVVMHLAEWFLPRCVDQLIDVCAQKVPMTVLMSFGGIGGGGPTHDGRYSLGMLHMLPNATVWCPASVEDFARVFRLAVQDGAPAFIRLQDEDCADMQCGKRPEEAQVVVPGDSVTLIPIGGFYRVCSALAREIPGVELLYVPRVKPLDMDSIRLSVGKTRCALLVENGLRAGGVGQAIIETLSNSGMGWRCRLLAAPDKFLDQGSPEVVLSDSHLTKEEIMDEIRSLTVLGSSRGRERCAAG